MTKTQAITLFGGTPIALARACNVSRQAVNSWPEELPPRIRDRVEAALYRQSVAKARKPAKVAA